MFSLDISDVKNKKISIGSFDEMQGKGIKLFLATTYVIIYSLGKYDKEKYTEIFERLYRCFTETFEAEISAYESLLLAENNLAECIKYFEPRSIVTSQQLYPQDFFVVPSFENSRENPFKIIKESKKSCRILIRAKTGLGKSSLLKMAAVCMLNRKLGLAENKENPLDTISKDMGVPEDKFVLFIPAKMFSFCYASERYKEWTKDLIALFFNAMWKLYPAYNFFAEQGNQRNSLLDDEPEVIYNVTQELVEYLEYLSTTGKLVVLLDSYDEISSGELRNAYLKMLTAFNCKYCRFGEAKEVGAHVVVTSREMSDDTMQRMNRALELEDLFEISYLNSNQRRELLLKWDKLLGIDTSDSKIRLDEIEYNHFYKDYSVNPYMFSVVCFILDEK